MRLQILGMAEVTSESNFRRSSPCKGDKCCRTPGFPCKRDVGGNCWREGVGYTLWCQECREEVVAYLGETGRNACTRGLEHLKSLKATSQEKSVLCLHSLNDHQGGVPHEGDPQPQDPNDTLVRQRVNIRNFGGQDRIISGDSSHLLMILFHFPHCSHFLASFAHWMGKPKFWLNNYFFVFTKDTFQISPSILHEILPNEQHIGITP